MNPVLPRNALLAGLETHERWEVWSTLANGVPDNELIVYCYCELEQL